jgi:hypothetical protein
MAINVDICQLCAFAAFHGGLLTIVDAGIDSVQQPANLIGTSPITIQAIIKLAFSSPESGPTYEGSFEVFSPTQELLFETHMDILSTSPAAVDVIPYTYTVLSALSFTPTVPGVYQVRFSIKSQFVERILPLRLVASENVEPPR